MKLLLTLALACITTLSSQAQDFERWSLWMGGGPNFSDVIPLQNTERSVLGTAYQLELAYRPRPRFQARIGLGYAQKGKRGEVVFTDEIGTPIRSADLYQELNYLRLPLMARWQIRPDSKFQLIGGVWSGTLLSARQILDDPDFGTESDVTNQFQSTDAGVTFGVSWTKRFLKPVALEVELSYDYGTQDIATTQGQDALTTRMVRLSVNLGMGLSKQ